MNEHHILSGFSPRVLSIFLSTFPILLYCSPSSEDPSHSQPVRMGWDPGFVTKSGGLIFDCSIEVGLSHFTVAKIKNPKVNRRSFAAVSSLGARGMVAVLCLGRVA